MALACFLDLFMFSRVLTLWPMEAGERDRPEVGDGHRLNGVPLLGTSRVSMPPSAPTNSTSQPELRVWNIWGQGHGGIDMARRSPAGKEDSHSFFLLLVM